MRSKKVLRFLVFVTTLFSFVFSLTILASAVNDIDFNNLSFKAAPRETETLPSLLDLLTTPSEIGPITPLSEESTSIAETTPVATSYTEPSEVETTAVLETESVSVPETTVAIETVPAETTSEETDPNLVIFNNREYYIPFISLNNEPMVSSSGYVEQITEVPHYIQQYYDVKYGNHGTVADHGCGVTCLAMVYSYLLDEEITPDELAKKYGRYNTKVGSDYGLFNNTAIDYNLVVEKQTYNWNDVYSALLNGQVVIANPTDPSMFTDGGHFIVLAGLTEDGKIIVRDPSIYNYGKWSVDALKLGFANGFEEKAIKYNCFPCWIYQPKDIEAVAARAESAANN